MIPGYGVENFPLMGRAIFQKATKRGDFFQKQVIFQSVPARLIAERSKRVRYDIDGGDMLAYWLHSGSFPSRTLFDAAMLNNLGNKRLFATLIMAEYRFKLKGAVTFRAI
jgi:hypothetical protein